MCRSSRSVHLFLISFASFFACVYYFTVSFWLCARARPHLAMSTLHCHSPRVHPATPYYFYQHPTLPLPLPLLPLP